MTDQFRIRAAVPGDAAGMVDVLNPIVAAGGTTAIEDPVTVEEMADVIATSLCCHVALDAAGLVAGMQWLDPSDAPHDRCGYISSFTQREPRLAGTGRALFAATVPAARAAGLTVLVAKIRADNMPGLGYYRAMGFQDHNVDHAVPLADGTPVDRVVWIYPL
ncbi:MAG: GNAT family N-acetyltransferase [Pseudomonadota bacterium]